MLYPVFDRTAAAIVTLTIMSRAGEPSAVFERVITLTLGAALVATAIAMMFRTRIVLAAKRRFGSTGPEHRVIETVILGAILGVLVSISSAGAGALGVTALLVLYPGLPVSRIVGSDIAHAVPLTLVAGIGHWLIGTVNFELLAALLIGSIPGIILGSLIGSRAPDRVLQPLLAGVLTLVGLKLLTS